MRANPEIIDIHCHCAGIGAGRSGCFISKSMRNSWKYRFYLRSFKLTEEELQEEGDLVCIRKIGEQVGQSEQVDGALILALDAAIDPLGNIDYSQTQIYIPNSFVLNETAKYDNLFWGASVNPGRKDALKRLDWCKENGAKLIKWLPSIQGINPSEIQLESFYLKLVELDLPLLTHTGDEHAFDDAENKLADPTLLRFPLELGVTVVAAHLGGSGKNQGEHNIDRVINLMEKFPNLWADISAMTLIHRKRILKKILQISHLHGRLLYGTDYPLINIPLTSPYFYPLRLTRKQMVSISRIQNVWDRNMALKKDLGVPSGTFENSARFLKIE